jgi:hypothetical protein
LGRNGVQTIAIVSDLTQRNILPRVWGVPAHSINSSNCPTNSRNRLTSLLRSRPISTSSPHHHHDAICDGVMGYGFDTWIAKNFFGLRRKAE